MKDTFTEDPDSPTSDWCVFFYLFFNGFRNILVFIQMEDEKIVN